MKGTLSWWPGVVAWFWLAIVQGVWGIKVALLVGVSMLAVALLALWEAGGQEPPHAR